MWDHLPRNIRLSTLLANLMKILKSHPFSKAYCTAVWATTVGLAPYKFNHWLINWLMPMDEWIFLGFVTIYNLHPASPQCRSTKLLCLSVPLMRRTLWAERSSRRPCSRSSSTGSTRWVLMSTGPLRIHTRRAWYSSYVDWVHARATPSSGWVSLHVWITTLKFISLVLPLH